MNNQYFKLFSNCILVQGAYRSIVMDLQRSQFFTVSSGLAALLNYNQVAQSSVQELYMEYNHIEKSMIDKFLNQLVSQEVGLITESPLSFPDIPDTFDTSEEITDITIVVTENSKNQLNNLSKKIAFYTIQAIFLSHETDLINQFLTITSDIGIRNLQLYINCSKQLVILEDIKKSNHLESVILFNSGQERSEIWDNEIELRFTNRNITLFSGNSPSSDQDFILNLPYYFESKQVNPYLSGRLFIDEGGLSDIRYNDNTSFDIKDKNNSAKYVCRDKIVICRDCEYRYMCTDTRVPRIYNDMNELWNHLSECPYNPYIAKWNTEEGHQTVAESIADGVVSEEFVYREK